MSQKFIYKADLKGRRHHPKINPALDIMNYY